jgi:hypothetical protein
VPRRKKTEESVGETVGLHVRMPKELYERLLLQRDRLRKKRPMTNLSETVREILERGTP